MITLVGMGTNKDDVSLRALSAVRSATSVWLRTDRLSAAATLRGLGIPFSTMDDLYESAPDFDALQSAIVERLSSQHGAVYCVDGSGTDDPILPLLKAACEVSVIPGVSPAVGALAAAGISAPAFSTQSATALVAERVFYRAEGVLVITEIDDPYLAGEVKLRLLDAYGNVEGYWYRDGCASSCLVEDLDRQGAYGADCAYVLPSEELRHRQRFTVTDLIRIIFRLRDPDGCDWDKVQTHQSIRACAVEEAYELVEAIDREDIDMMLEETGDVLLQAIFHASLAEDAGEFSTTDMVTAICQKMLTRHPHVFGDVVAHGQEEALAAWDAAKAKEKKQGTFADRMRQVAPQAALMRAHKVQKIASKAGFDWHDARLASQKIAEELEELWSATTPEERELEGGDLLFAVVNTLRLAGVGSEEALLKSCQKFERRFIAVEERVLSLGKQMTALSLDELEDIYQQIKAEEV